MMNKLYPFHFYADEDLKWETPHLMSFHLIHLSVTITFGDSSSIKGGLSVIKSLLVKV